MGTGILLESGTNELEILEFCIGNNYYGINVAKVREIIQYKEPTPIPESHPCIEGIYMPRDVIITIVDLAKTMGLGPSARPETDMYIVTNFNNLNVAFHVHSVVGITKVSWSEISKPDATLGNDGSSIATGIIKLNGRLTVILDFEKIVADISPETSLKISDIERLGKRERNTKPILIAEDSALLSKLICDCLTKAGYTNVMVTADGQEAWNKLNEYKAEGSLDQKVQLVITDIEMPKMDGHRLTKLIKDSSDFSHIPVVIFSSLVNDEMRRKGEELGADAQLSKPEIGDLVTEIDKILWK